MLRPLPFLLGLLGLARDVATLAVRSVADRLAPPRTPDAIASTHRDVCAGPDWLDATPAFLCPIRRDIDTDTELRVAAVARLDDEEIVALTMRDGKAA